MPVRPLPPALVEWQTSATTFLIMRSTSAPRRRLVTFFARACHFTLQDMMSHILARRSA
jgi:hypothetical protein